MRENGFYRVKLKNNEWLIAEYNKDVLPARWYLTFDSQSYPEDYFLEIDERKIIYNG